jgi:hypothetical protein
MVIAEAVVSTSQKIPSEGSVDLTRPVVARLDSVVMRISEKNFCLSLIVWS